MKDVSLKSEYDRIEYPKFAEFLNVVFLNETNAKAFIASRNLEILSTHCVSLENYIKVLNVQLQKEREKNDEDL